jgi:hypothetical protein
VLVAAVVLLLCGRARAQANDGMLSEKEVESLRDAAYEPMDRLKAYEKILNTREDEITSLMARPKHVSFGDDIHDAMDQFGQIADELNDNLDEYSRNHRDLRKELPKLIKAADRWSTVLRSPPDDDRYKIVRRIALDAVRDLRTATEQMQADQEAYFKLHPEAARQESNRRSDPHAPASGEEPK